MGGGVWATTSNDLPNYKREWEAGRETGSGSGQIAMKFELFQADTIFNAFLFTPRTLTEFIHITKN